MDFVKTLIPKLSFEKKETFLKLAILTCAAILCKYPKQNKKKESFN
jgi:hypothetical protein